VELRHLEAFVAVAEERSFTRAAVRLHVAQSGLSATIRSLERELHTELFARTTRQVELAPAGHVLLPEARRTLASARHATEAVAAVEGVERGTLTLGVLQASTIINLPGLLQRYRKAFPGIHLAFRQASTADLGGLLADREVDVIFTSDSDDRFPDLLSIPLLRTPLVIAFSPDDPFSGRWAIPLRSLRDRAQVGFPLGWGIRTLTDMAMIDAGVQPNYEFEVNDTNTLLDLVEGGLGVTVIAEALVESLRPQLGWVPIKGRQWHWVVAAQALGPIPPNPAARALWAMLTEP
jgi:DNA-binding transcriptional LysR family regulator